MNQDQKGVATFVGGAMVFGVLSSIWAYYEAQAAVKVRPRLNNVDLITAFLTGHGFDWLYYFHPIPTAVVWTVIWTLAGVIAWKLM